MTATVVGGWLLWCGVALFGSAALASNAVTMVALVQSVPPQQLVAATSKIVTGMYIGFAIGPPSFGLLLEWGNGFAAAWLLPLNAFTIAALITATRSAAGACLKQSGAELGA